MTEPLPERMTPPVDRAALARLFDLSGARVFLPGGYGALGEALSWGFAVHGARVAVAGPSAAKSERLAAALYEDGHRADAFALDARSCAAIEEVVEAAAAAMGGIDVLVNCVGIQREEKLLDVSEAAFDLLYETNLKSAMFLAQAVARGQIARGRGGRHIHLLSVRATLGLSGRGYSAYCATKGGLAMLVRQHALELAPYAITVNGIAPTFIRSDRIRGHLERPEFRDFILSRNPMGRIGDPIEVVGPVLALAAAAGSYVTGQILHVDGGVTAGQC